MLHVQGLTDTISRGIPWREKLTGLSAVDRLAASEADHCVKDAAPFIYPSLQTTRSRELLSNKITLARNREALSASSRNLSREAISSGFPFLFPFSFIGSFPGVNYDTIAGLICKMILIKLITCRVIRRELKIAMYKLLGRDTLAISSAYYLSKNWILGCLSRTRCFQGEIINDSGNLYRLSISIYPG